MCSVMFVSSTSVYLAVRVVWVSDTVVTGSLPVTLLTRVQKHVLMLAYLFYLSTSTLTLHNNNTTSSNRLFTCVYVRTIAHTKELLNTLLGHTRSSNQLSWPTGGKKNRVYRFSMGWYISTWFII